MRRAALPACVGWKGWGLAGGTPLPVAAVSPTTRPARGFQSRVEIGARATYPIPDAELRAAQATIRGAVTSVAEFGKALDAALAPKPDAPPAATLSVSATLLGALDVAASKGDMPTLLEGQEAWDTSRKLASRLLKGGAVVRGLSVSAELPPPRAPLPGEIATQRMLCHTALGDCETALEWFAAHFDGEKTPPTQKTYATLIHILGLRNAPPADWREVLEAAVSHQIPLDVAFFDALMERLMHKSPLLTWVAYVWRLSLDVPCTPAAYSSLLCSIYREPEYGNHMLCLLTQTASSPKNSVNLVEFLENADFIASHPDLLWGSRAGSAEGNPPSASDPTLEVNASSGLPRVSGLPDPTEEVELLKILAQCVRGTAANAKLRITEDTAIPSACINCRAVTPSGWVMRVLTEAHKSREIVVDESAYPHYPLYLSAMAQLHAWGRHEDICGLFKLLTYFSNKMQRHYADNPDFDDSHSKTPLLCHTPETYARALSAAGEARLTDFARKTYRQFQLSEIKLDRGLLNAVLVALPAEEEAINLYKSVKGNPAVRTLPDVRTVKALLKSCLVLAERHEEAVMSGTPTPPPPTRPPAAEGGQGASAAAPRSEGEAFRASLFPGDVWCASPELGSPVPGSRAAASPSAMRGMMRETETEQRRSFLFLMEQVGDLGFLLKDSEAHALQVAVYLRWGDLDSAVAACCSMLDSHFSLTPDIQGLWRHHSSWGGVKFTDFFKAVNEKRGGGGDAFSFPSPKIGGA